MVLVVKQLAKEIELIAYRMTFIEDELQTLQKANEVLQT
jgi:hypothetical protein